MDINNYNLFLNEHFSENSMFYCNNSTMFLLNGLNLNNNPLFEGFRENESNNKYLNTVTSLFTFLNFGFLSTQDYLKPENEAFLNFLKMEPNVFVLLKYNNELRFNYNLKLKDGFLFASEYNDLVQISMLKTLSDPSFYSQVFLNQSLKKFSDTHNPNIFTTKIKTIFSQTLRSKQDIISDSDAITISRDLLSKIPQMKTLYMQDSFTPNELKDIKFFTSQSQVFFSYVKKKLFSSSLDFISEIKKQEGKDNLLRQSKISIDANIALSLYLLSGIQDEERPSLTYSCLNFPFSTKYVLNKDESSKIKEFLQNFYYSLHEDTHGYLEKNLLQNSQNPFFTHQKKFFTSISDIKFQQLLPNLLQSNIKSQMDTNLTQKLSKFTNYSGANPNIFENIQDILKENKLNIKMNEHEMRNGNKAKISYKPKKI